MRKFITGFFGIGRWVQTIAFAISFFHLSLKLSLSNVYILEREMNGTKNFFFFVKNLNNIWVVNLSNFRSSPQYGPKHYWAYCPEYRNPRMTDTVDKKEIFLFPLPLLLTTTTPFINTSTVPWSYTISNMQYFIDNKHRPLKHYTQCKQQAYRENTTGSCKE